MLAGAEEEVAEEVGVAVAVAVVETGRCAPRRSAINE